MPTALQRINAVIPGTPIDPFVGQKTSVPGSVEEILTFTVPVDTEYYLTSAFGTCRFLGEFKILIDNNSLGFGNTTETDNDFNFSWTPYIRLVAGQVVKVNFDALSDFPAADVEAQIQLNEKSV